MRRCAMDRRRLFQALSLSFGLLLAASILTPQGGDQDGIKFEMPRDDVKKKAPKLAAASPATVEVLNSQSAGIEALVDGDAVKLKVTLEKAVEMAYVASFKFADDERQIDKCIIPPGAQSCETKVAPALGWYWGKDGKGLTEREIRAESGDQGLSEVMNFSGTVKLRVSARPVVFIHGLASNAAGWAEYTKQGGYLAAMGLRGFAVGDGQAEGEM